MSHDLLVQVAYSYISCKSVRGIFENTSGI